MRPRRPQGAAAGSKEGKKRMPEGSAPRPFSGKNSDSRLKAAANGLPDRAYSVLMAPGRILVRPRPPSRHFRSLKQAKTVPQSRLPAQTADLTLFGSRFSPGGERCIAASGIPMRAPRSATAPASRPACDPIPSGCYPAQGIIVRFRLVCGGGPASSRPYGAQAMHPPLIPGKNSDSRLKTAANGLPDRAYSVLIESGRILVRPRPCIRHLSRLKPAKTALYSGLLAQTADLTTRCAAPSSSRFTPCGHSFTQQVPHTPFTDTQGSETNTDKQRLPAQKTCSDGSPHRHTALIRFQEPRTQNQLGGTSVEAHHNTPDHRSPTPFSIPQNPAPTDPRKVFDFSRIGCSIWIGLGVRFRRNLHRP